MRVMSNNTSSRRSNKFDSPSKPTSTMNAWAMNGEVGYEPSLRSNAIWNGYKCAIASATQQLSVEVTPQVTCWSAKHLTTSSSPIPSCFWEEKRALVCLYHWLSSGTYLKQRSAFFINDKLSAIYRKSPLGKNWLKCACNPKMGNSQPLI